MLQGYGFHEGGGITSLATHPTNAHVILTGAQDGSSVLSNISTGKPMGMTKNHSESVETVAFCNSMPFHATGGMDKLIMIYDSNTFQLRGQFAHEVIFWKFFFFVVFFCCYFFMFFCCFLLLFF